MQTAVFADFYYKSNFVINGKNEIDLRVFSVEIN